MCCLRTRPVLCVVFVVLVFVVLVPLAGRACKASGQVPPCAASGLPVGAAGSLAGRGPASLCAVCMSGLLLMTAMTGFRVSDARHVLQLFGLHVL